MIGETSRSHRIPIERGAKGIWQTQRCGTDGLRAVSGRPMRLRLASRTAVEEAIVRFDEMGWEAFLRQYGFHPGRSDPGKGQIHRRSPSPGLFCGTLSELLPGEVGGGDATAQMGRKDRRPTP